MSAKEMFEELGYEYKESYFNNKLNRIIITDDYKYSTHIIFAIENQSIKATLKNDQAGWVSMKLLKAINKQVEELRWEE